MARTSGFRRAAGAFKASTALVGVGLALALPAAVMLALPLAGPAHAGGAGGVSSAGGGDGGAGGFGGGGGQGGGSGSAQPGLSQPVGQGGSGGNAGGLNGGPGGGAGESFGTGGSGGTAPGGTTAGANGTDSAGGGGGGAGGQHGLVGLLPVSTVTGQAGGAGGIGGIGNGSGDAGGGGAGGWGSVVTGAATGVINNSITGGSGGAGGTTQATSVGVGGGGGGGGLGIFFQSSANDVTFNQDVSGGNGGVGGNGIGAGGGGGGGEGIVFGGAATNIVIAAASSVRGGVGGNSGTAVNNPANAGSGGAGIVFQNGGSLTNLGTISGGNGGSAGGTAGAGGAGIVGSAITINNGGSISGGLGGGGALANAISFTGGANTLVLNGGSLTGNIDIASGGSMDFATTNGQTLANAITGGGSVIKSGAGTVALAGGNSYSGGTTINAGAVNVQNGAALGSGAVTVAAGAALELQGSITVNNALTLNGTGVANGGALRNVNGGNDTYNGAITLGSDALINNDFGTFVITGAITGAGKNLTMSVGVGTIGVAGPIMTGSGGLTVNGGTGSVQLSGTNTYTGVTTVNSGVLTLGNGSAIADTGAVVVNSGSLRVSSSETIGSLAGGGDVGLETNFSNVTLTTGGDNTSTIFSGVISQGFMFPGSAGSLVKIGTGTLTLNGSSTYTGATTVSGGKLIVGDDTHSLASISSAVTVQSGATLGGHGSVGSTTVESGGTLAPGASIGKLTVNGDMTLQQGSHLAYEAAAPGADFTTAGFADSVLVKGNVTLNGAVLDVTGLSGFGPGLYRIVDYTGTLTESNGGLVLGTVPSGSVLSIQTLTADKQINLINIGGLTLNLWNANGLADATHMGGGSGTWSNTSPVWTDATGAVTAAMQPQPGFAVFGGAAGTVNVVGSAGAVQTTGMQFASSGYTLIGDTLTLVADADHPAPVEVRVGDGSAASAGYVSTISNVVAGTDGLRKTGAGTLVLSGTNTYSGGTTIEAGTLSVAADINLGATGEALTFNGGALQVTGTAFTQTTRSITLAAGGGTFDIANGANTFVVGQSISGAGGLTKAGSGGLSLANANAYAGATVVNAGELSLDGAGSIASSSGLAVNGGIFNISGLSGTGTIVNTLSGTGGEISLGGKTLTVQQTANAGYAGVMTGTGSVIKDGAGTLTLTGASAGFTGAVQVDAGTLALSGSGSLASAQSVTLSDGSFDLSAVSGASSINNLSGAGGLLQLGSTALTINQSTDAVFAGDILGTATAVKAGAATLTLTGISATDWSITGGGLTTSSASLGGDVAIGTNGTLTFNEGTLGSTTSVLSGTGALVKAGTGVLAYNGDGSGFDGTTTVADGTLLVGSGVVLGGSLDVLDGAILGGHGTIGSGSGSVVTVESGGTLSPGASIGTLTLDGNLVFDAGGHFEIETDPASTAGDLVKVTGTATINGGAVAHIGADGGYKPTSTYTILTADDGVHGHFDSVTSDFAFLDPFLIYDANNVLLKLDRNDVDFTDMAATSNQKAVAGALGTLDPSSSLYQAILVLSNDGATVRNAFDQLSGEAYPSFNGVLVQDSQRIADIVNARIGSAFGAVGAADAPVIAYGEEDKGNAGTGAIHGMLSPATTSRVAAWATAFGSWEDNDGDGNAAGVSSSTGGFLTGVDGAFGENWRAGVVAGYSHSSFHVDARASSGDSQNWHLGLYGGGQWGAFGLRGGAAYTWHNISSGRHVAFDGFEDSLSADYDAGTAQAFGEIAYDVKAGQIGLEPFAGLSYVSLHTDGFEEEGGDAALSASSTNTDVTFTTVGLRASSDFALGATNVTARGTLAWRHAFGDVTPTSTFAFDSSDAFTIAGAPIARDAALIQAGLDVVLSGNASLGLAYQGQFGSGSQQNGFDANLTVKF